MEKNPKPFALKAILPKLLLEMADTLEQVNQEDFFGVAEKIWNTNRVFVTGAGRVGLCAKSFAMRLVHLGKTAYILGEVTTPSAQPGDALVALSAGGTSTATCGFVHMAKQKNIDVIAISGNPSSELWTMADYRLMLPGPSRDSWKNRSSLQPMGTTFEQSLLVLLDTMILYYMHRYSIPVEEMLKRHSNLE